VTALLEIRTYKLVPESWHTLDELEPVAIAGRVDKSGLDAPGLEAACRESQAVAELHALNAAWVRAFAESDAAWYSEHLKRDFVCTLPDGQRIGKREFLRRTRRRRRIGRVGCDDIDVRLLDDVGLVHGVTYHRSDKRLFVTRYTNVWQSRHARWQAVAMQFTPVREPRGSKAEDRRFRRWFQRR
jgi:Domain of unknown function (DUF4440)